MSQADELLNGLSGETVSTYTVNPATEPHIVIGADRFITVPDELKRIAVQFDHDVETVTFDCPRYWDGLDMSKLRIYVNYRRSDKAYGCFKAENITVDEADETIMHFTWTVSQNVTLVAGKIQFLVCIRKMDEDGYEKNHWNSELNSEMYVSEGMECAEVVLEPYPDVIGQWEEDVEAVKDILLNARDAGEFDGATFTPAIAEDGTLSWTNDRDRENPAPVNIASHIDVTEIEGGHQVDVTDIRGTETFKVMHGVSTTVSIEDIEGGHRLAFTDVNGTKSIDVLHGTSSNVTVEAIDGGYRLVVSDSTGTKSVDVMHGVSPIIEVTDTTAGHRVTITDVNGTQIFDVLDGGTEVIDNYMKNYVAISDTEPAAGPVLWFDTSMESAE